MNNPLGVSPSKGKQGTTRGKEKILLTSVGIEPTTSGLDLPSPVDLILRLWQLSESQSTHQHKSPSFTPGLLMHKISDLQPFSD